MDNLTGSMKDVAFATSPREFDLSYSTTLEEIMEKLNARRAAFQMPFQIKGGIPGQRISFEKEPNVDVGLWLFLKDGTHIRIQPVITEAKMSVGGMRVDKNSALRKGLKGATVGLATERGGYIDTVTETVKKILNGEEVEDYVAPEVPVETKDWLTTFLLCLFLWWAWRPPLLCRQDRHGYSLYADGRSVRHRIPCRLYQDSLRQVYRQGREPYPARKEIRKAKCLRYALLFFAGMICYFLLIGRFVHP